ncbi:MAG: serine/threonine-protein kinase, partial [Thermoanaerobaculia bacterium]
MRDDETEAKGDAAARLHAASTIDLPTAYGPGVKIGPYRILQLLGEGGFGSVYMAEQVAPIQRRVALKVIKLGMDTREVIARFEQERQALAMMDHPGIAHVFDAGETETGRPYFVMELVKGEPVTEYCDRHKLSIAARLALFGEVCAAVQHAHTKGIIHRDLKPSNVLVSAQEGEVHARIIDFGIAKATSGNLTEKTLFTEHRQLIGTPEYMSPEQAEGSLDIDTRTDVYALGVLLYELLTGTTPFDSRRLRSAAYGEVQRILREDDPPRPSTRLSQSMETIAAVAAHRHTDPGKLASQLRGELDWIVMKALEKDRLRRYETASGLAIDIQRYLTGEPVSAAPPSAAYRLRKFVLRHRTGVAAANLVAAALVAAVVGISWQAREARAQRDKAEQVAGFMAEMLRGVEPSVARGRDTTMLTEMMNAAAARIERGE